MYLRKRTNAARKPYFIEVNCSNSPSVLVFSSPNHTFPMRIFSGLLLRIPRGISLLFVVMCDDGCKFLDVVLQPEYGASQQECLSDIHQHSVGHIINVRDLVKSECNAAENQQHCTCIASSSEIRSTHISEN